MLLTPDKAEAQLLKKLGKAVNEVSNVIGNKNDKKGSKKQKSGTVQGAGIQQTDTEVYGGETENNQEEDDMGYVSGYAGKLKKGNLISRRYNAEKYFTGYKVTPSTKTIYHDGHISSLTVAPFHDGMAIARIGSMYYFITAAGEKIKPELQFDMADFSKPEIWPHFENGRFLAKTDDGAVIFDKQGKVVKRLGKDYTASTGFKSGIGILIKDHSEMTLVNTEGNVVGKITGSFYGFGTNGTPFLNELRDGRRACILYNDDAKSDRIGFLDESNKIIIPGKYIRAHDFHDGLAAVQIKDEAGELKWGFIDRQGKTAIDFKFSKEPTDFYGGRASVFSKEGKRAIIDKTGNITSKWDHVSPFTSDGYAIMTEREEGALVHHVILSVDESGNKYAYFNPYTTYTSDDCLLTDEPGVIYCPITFNPSYYEMVTLPSLESTFELIRYPFSAEGLTSVPDGVINDKGEYVVIFKENEF